MLLIEKKSAFSLPTSLSIGTLLACKFGLCALQQAVLCRISVLCRIPVQTCVSVAGGISMRVRVWLDANPFCSTQAKIKKNISIDCQLQQAHGRRATCCIRFGHTCGRMGAAIWQRWPAGYSRRSQAWPRRSRSVREICARQREHKCTRIWWNLV